MCDVDSLRKNTMFSMLQDLLDDTVLSDDPIKIPIYGHCLLSKYEKCYPGDLEKNHKEWLQERLELINQKQKEMNAEIKEKYKDNPALLDVMGGLGYLQE